MSPPRDPHADAPRTRPAPALGDRALRAGRVGVLATALALAACQAIGARGGAAAKAALAGAARVIPGVQAGAELPREGERLATLVEAGTLQDSEARHALMNSLPLD